MGTSTVCREIYSGRDKNYAKELIALENSSLSSQDKELILQWHRYLFTKGKGSGKLRVAKLSSQLRKIAEKLGCEFSTITRTAIERVLAEYNLREDLSDATKADYRRCIKQFYNWYKDYDERFLANEREAVLFYKYIENDISIAYDEKQYDYSGIITDEDARNLINAALNTKDRAFIAVLHEGGFRVGEMLGMRIKDVQFAHDRVLVHVDGKTGHRTVPLLKSVVHLSR